MAAIAVPTGSLPRELSPAQRALRRLARRRGAMVGLVLVVFFVAIALLAPWTRSTGSAPTRSGATCSHA